MNMRMQEAAHLSTYGLYDPAEEHDACGVGLIAAMDGRPSRQIVEKAIAGLKAVYHRGAVDADGKTGDGAGIHVQIPQAFFKQYITSMGLNAQQGQLAVGMIFLPRKNFAAKEACRAIIEQEVLRSGFRIYGWRQVPIISDVIGDVANDTRPEIEQILLSGKQEWSHRFYENQLYLTRKRIEKKVWDNSISDLYICSLSCLSIVYKGLFKAEQLDAFYPDLTDEQFVSNYALFHQRFSTNTAPAWPLAQPFRVLAHNGEINTLRGNRNFMRSHEANFTCDAFTGVEEELTPVIPPNSSDTASLDAVAELLTRSGRELPLVKSILIPPAWSMIEDMPQAHKDLFSFCNSISEPWDGPAAIVACDSEWAIAGLDRNGLRPLRYTITTTGLFICASESGMIPVADTEVAERGKLGPGETMGVHLQQGTLYRSNTLNDYLAMQYPYADWCKNILQLQEILPKDTKHHLPMEEDTLRRFQLATAHTYEEIETILYPMAETGKEAIGSMGDDTPLAVLTSTYRGFHHFFRQKFSQVTNPPIDSLRERRVMSLFTRFGNDGNYLALDKSHSQILLSETPILLSHEMEALKKHFHTRITKLDTLFNTECGGNCLRKGIQQLIEKAEEAVSTGKPYLLLTDEAMDSTHAPIPMILAVSAVNSHLVKQKLRKQTSIIVKTAECFDVHASAVLIGAGATVINPYVAEATLLSHWQKKNFASLTKKEVLENYREALNAGLLKIMSKMGISVISSYRGGLNFEAIGLARSLTAEFFPGLASRISGIGLGGIERRIRALHTTAFHDKKVEHLPIGGFYRSRAQHGEAHGWEGEALHTLQRAVDKGSFRTYREYKERVHALPPIHLRDMLEFRHIHEPIPIDQVEPITEIRKRFVAPAMSLGALSPEAHEVLAIAMNRMGATSNSGEGGEGPERFSPRANGDNANSVIKQIASARFGVTADYLLHANEIQIKVAQGAKPGEGGQLPGFKVTTEIARLRHATPGVTLISPPPHHDIYSIEDLAQLIYDLKQINPHARVSVKLVATSGVGTIASGVAKAMADKIIIAGHNGGTGASAWSSVKHAGIPWEMGLAEANQVLTLNRLRDRIILQTDGGLKTGRDIVIAAILGAEEYAIGTAALVALGCIMVRQCHSNTCPVGITTQDPALRQKFEGTVEKAINLFSFLAEDIRETLASMGIRSLDEIIGRSDYLIQTNRGEHDLVDLDLNPLLSRADFGGTPALTATKLRNDVPESLDITMLKDAETALQRGEKIQLAYSVRNTMRTIGTRLSSAIVENMHKRDIQDDHILLKLRGSAGQSLGAFAVRGLKIQLFGDANDYVGKGLSGATIVIRPRPSSELISHHNVIIGNTVLYGATSGKLFANGIAGERFAVRNSGAIAVVEGCGSNGCEYMTGGIAVILGQIGHNFAAGMTGGMAFVYDDAECIHHRINDESVLYQRIQSSHWEHILKALLETHTEETASQLAAEILAGWQWELPKFWQICPLEMVNRLENPLNEKNYEASSLAG